MLDQNTSAQLKTLLERLESPIEIVATLNGSDKSNQIKELVEEVAALSALVTARFDGKNSRAPSFGIAKAGEEPRVFFAGLPMGHEFTSLILSDFSEPFKVATNSSGPSRRSRSVFN